MTDRWDNAGGADGGAVPWPGPAGGPGDGGEVLDVTVVDRAGRRLMVGSAQVLGGLLTAGLLHHVRTPGALVDVLAPHVPPGPERDRLVFTAGAAAGLWAGQQRRATRWDPAELQDAADDLYAAGWAAMGALAEDAAAVGELPPWRARGGR